MNEEFGNINFELTGGRKKLQSIINSVYGRELFLREHGEQIKKVAEYNRGNEEKEVYHINGTTLTINYSGKCIPISVYGERKRIEGNIQTYEKLLGDNLIPTGEFNNYFKVRIIENDN